METLKSTRFWILLAIVIGLVVLAALGRVEGSDVLKALMGVLAGFGVGKTAGVKVVQAPATVAKGSIIPIESGDKE